MWTLLFELFVYFVFLSSVALELLLLIYRCDLVQVGGINLNKRNAKQWLSRRQVMRESCCEPHTKITVVLHLNYCLACSSSWEWFPLWSLVWLYQLAMLRIPLCLGYLHSPVLVFSTFKCGVVHFFFALVALDWGRIHPTSIGVVGLPAGGSVQCADSSLS